MIDEWVSVSTVSGVGLVRLAGEIDLANATAIGREIAAHAGGAPALVVDLTAVTFLDSAGVRLLDALVGEMEGRGDPVRLVVGESGPARMTLKLCAFRDDLLSTDVDRAVAELRG